MRQRVSLCLIVKNEEENLPACLDSAAGLVDDVVVVDTGSTDATKQVAQARGAHVFDFPWIDSFAAARNESIRHATGDWIFWMDADDRLDEDNRAKLRALFDQLSPEIAGYSMQVRCLPNPDTGTAMIVDHVRLFTHHPQIRWRYRVHEQIIPAISALGGVLRPTDIIIQHAGYLDTALRQRKNERNLRLLKLDDAENPDDPAILFQLGWTSLDMGRSQEAFAYLRQTLERSEGLSSMRKTYALLANTLYSLGQKQEAFAACQEGRRRFPEDAELIYMEGVLRKELGDLAGAEPCFQYLLSQEAQAQQFVSLDSGIFGYLSRFHLGETYFQQRRLAEAEMLWRSVVAERPVYANAWIGLTEIWRLQGQLQNLGEAEDAARRLEGIPQRAVDAAMLQGRIRMALQDYPAARQALERAISLAPTSIMPRLSLSHVLLMEGRDWNAAEAALRDVLALDPGNADATHNLNVLMQQFGR